MSKLTRRLHRFVWVNICQNATLLEITCHGLNELIFSTASRLSEKENSLMENEVDDFNGIFCNVDPEDNRVSVLFSTNELFSKFVTNLSQEFAEHKIAQKCFINIHKRENGLAVEGPGCRIWRETTFLRLAANLYRQYESDTNKNIEGTKQQATTKSTKPRNNLGHQYLSDSKQ